MVVGSENRLRFRRVGHAQQQTLSAEYRIANRDIPLEDGMGVRDLAKRVLEYFSASHQTIPWSTDAVRTFKGFSTCCNAQCAVARNKGEDVAAAQWGQTHGISACLLEGC